MSNYETYKNHQDAMAALVKSNGKDLVREMFGSIFAANPHVKFITMIGYTPGFNDGEACEFTTDVEYTTDYLTNIEEAAIEIAKTLGYTGDEDDIEEVFEFVNENNPNDFDYAEGHRIAGLINENLLEDVLGTDWVIAAYLDVNGEAQYFDEDYECGY